MKNVQREAKKDALEAAAASMAYGTGAGIRRRHIESAVMYKEDRIPGYTAAFNRELEKVDMSKAVKSAQRTGKVRDVGEITSKNVKALARGDKNGMSTPLLVAFVVVTVAHKTGYDKKAIDYTKRKSGDVRAWLKRNL